VRLATKVVYEDLLSHGKELTYDILHVPQVVYEDLVSRYKALTYNILFELHTPQVVYEDLLSHVKEFTYDILQAPQGSCEPGQGINSWNSV